MKQLDVDQRGRIRRRIEDALRKMGNDELLLRIAELLNIRTD